MSAPRLSSLRAALLVELTAAKRGRGGWIAAPTSRLARTLGYGRTSVLRGMRHLAALGLIEIMRAEDLERDVEPSRPLPVGHANRYRITVKGKAVRS